MQADSSTASSLTERSEVRGEWGASVRDTRDSTKREGSVEWVPSGLRHGLLGPMLTPQTPSVSHSHPQTPSTTHTLPSSLTLKHKHAPSARTQTDALCHATAAVAPHTRNQAPLLISSTQRAQAIPTRRHRRGYHAGGGGQVVSLPREVALV